MTGNIGRPGTGANSITGQCNAMGSRLFSNTTNLLGGHDFAERRASPEGRRHSGHRRRRDSRPRRVGPTTRSSKASCRRRSRACGSSPPTRPIRGSTSTCSATCCRGSTFWSCRTCTTRPRRPQLADLVLPAAAWGEKEGTFINSERRIGLIKKVAAAPGQALADFSIFRLIAEYWGCGEMFRRWTDPEAVFQILKELSRGQPCDITGIADYRMLDERGGIQWPYPGEAASEPAAAAAAAVRGRPVLPSPTARRKFLFDEPAPLPEAPERAVIRCCCSPAAAPPRSGTRKRAPASRPCSASSIRRKSTSRSIRPTPARLGIKPEPARRRRIAARLARRQGVRHARGAAGPGLPAHALRSRPTG